MLRVLGQVRTLCDRVSRRDLLRVGGLGLTGLGLSSFLRLTESAAAATETRPRSFGRAKSVILLHLYGAPSQIEFVDPKPAAPLEIRGELGSIRSSLPGCDVCELLPNLAKVMDRTTVLRSVTHPYPLHGVAFALTGVPAIDAPMELSRAIRGIGHFLVRWSTMSNRVDSRPVAQTHLNDAFPTISRCHSASARAAWAKFLAGPYAAFLGNEYDPVWTDFVGQATKSLPKTLAQQRFEDNDPYIGLSADSHFVVPSTTSLATEITLDRLDRRRTLLGQLDQARADLAASAGGRQFDRYRQMTYSLLESDDLRSALDVRREPDATRDLYGRTLFGQACLAARCLVEAGSRMVTVFWDEYGLAGSGWDTHWNHYPRMRQELCPGLDLAWYGLISDLDRRGLLDETLVVCTSEHGRTPHIANVEGGGRDHWSRVYSTLMAGGGIARGRVVGASDRHGGDVADRPISPKDMLATMYHLLGIDHHEVVHDAQGRPLPLVEGDVIHEALA